MDSHRLGGIHRRSVPIGGGNPVACWVVYLEAMGPVKALVKVDTVPAPGTEVAMDNPLRKSPTSNKKNQSAVGSAEPGGLL